jgi:hypothetical protein
MIDDFLNFLVQEIGFENVDEFLDSRPYITRPEKHMRLNLVCVECGRGYSEKFVRRHADRLAALYHCPQCKIPFRLESVIPFTVYFSSHSFKHASFSDETAGECWQCGATGNLHRFTYSNGQQIELCHTHFKRYARISYKLQTETDRSRAEHKEEQE